MFVMYYGRCQTAPYYLFITYYNSYYNLISTERQIIGYLLKPYSECGLFLVYI